MQFPSNVRKILVLKRYINLKKILRIKEKKEKRKTEKFKSSDNFVNYTKKKQINKIIENLRKFI